MIKRILKWTGVTLLVIIALVSVMTATRQRLTYDAPYPAIHASTDSAVIARGRHLALGPAHCVNCHNSDNPDSLMALGLEAPLSGGVKFHLPVGDIYSMNITPDRETGIGKYTDPEIARVLRHGVHPDGRAVYDFMPFHNLSNEDLTAVISFLRAQKPVSKTKPENSLNVIGNLVQAYLVKPVGPTEKETDEVHADTSAEYGRYLTLNIADCNGCHTKRDLSGAYIGAPFAGGGPMEENAGIFTPPNITPGEGSRIYRWSQERFVKRFKRGRMIKDSPMPWNSFQRMTEDELKAIYNFLQTVQPVKTKDEPSFTPKAS